MHLIKLPGRSGSHLDMTEIDIGVICGYPAISADARRQRLAKETTLDAARTVCSRLY